MGKYQLTVEIEIPKKESIARTNKENVWVNRDTDWINML